MPDMQAWEVTDEGEREGKKKSAEEIQSCSLSTGRGGGDGGGEVERVVSPADSD